MTMTAVLSRFAAAWQQVEPCWPELFLAVRRRLGISQAAMAERLDISESNLSRLERGEGHEPRPCVLAALAREARKLK